MTLVPEYFGLTSVLDPENIVVSHSDLAAFKRDRQKWFLATYLGLRPKSGEHPVSPLVLGTLIHKALELNYRDKVPLMDAYREVVGMAFEELRRLPEFPHHLWNKQAEMGRIMLAGYDEWNGNADAEYELIDVERQLLVGATYHGHPVSLIGRADHIVRHRLTGLKLVFDWKTTSNMERSKVAAHKSEQLVFYMTLEQAMAPEVLVDGAAYTMLKKSMQTTRSKGPHYQREHVTFTPQGLENRQRGIHGAVNDLVYVILCLHGMIEHPDPLTLVYPNNTGLVFRSPYDHLCEAWDEGDDLARMIRMSYEQKDPYERYRSTELASTDDDE